MHGEFQSGGVASIQERGKRKIDSIEVRCASGNAVMLSTAGRHARYANRACRLGRQRIQPAVVHSPQICFRHQSHVLRLC
jgi:hypothetical protein